MKHAVANVARMGNSVSRGKDIRMGFSVTTDHFDSQRSCRVSQRRISC
jgi:hypothetical protein